MHDLTGRGVGLKVLAGQGANLDTTTANDRLVFGIFAALAELERELTAERTRTGLASARAAFQHARTLRSSVGEAGGLGRGRRVPGKRPRGRFRLVTAELRPRPCCAD